MNTNTNTAAVVTTNATDKNCVAFPSADQQATLKSIEQIVGSRESWEQTVYRTSNDMLYALLQDCYRYYKTMEGDAKDEQGLRKSLNNYIEQHGYRFTKSTHTITKIVKCVFGAERRRVSAYSITLRYALQLGKCVADIPDFIRNGGGVEEIRLAKSANAMTAKQKAAAATEVVAEKDLGIFSSKALAEQFNDAGKTGKTGKQTVLIGEWQADGSIVVRSVVASDTVLTAALASCYSTSQAAQRKNAANTKAYAKAEQEKLADKEAAKEATAKALTTARVAA